MEGVHRAGGALVISQLKSAPHNGRRSYKTPRCFAARNSSLGEYMCLQRFIVWDEYDLYPALVQPILVPWAPTPA